MLFSPFLFDLRSRETDGPTYQQNRWTTHTLTSAPYSGVISISKNSRNDDHDDIDDDHDDVDDDHDDVLTNLFPALMQCVFVILVGYSTDRMKLVPASGKIGMLMVVESQDQAS